MSSLRNSLHRRNHKERSQLSNRSRLGILEKHKDYVLRARDYHSKKDRIKRLKQKAADRNKDEFYFGMVKQRTQNGVHIQERGNVSLPTDMIKILKTQDENYIRTMRALGAKKIEKIKAQLTEMADLFDSFSETANDDIAEEGLSQEDLKILQKAGVISSVHSVRLRTKQKAKYHIIFVADEKEGRSYSKNLKTRNSLGKKTIDSEQIDLGWETDEETRKNDKLQERKEKDVGAHDQKEQRAEAIKHRTRLLKELAARLERDIQLRYAERELEMQRLLMGKGASKKISGIEKVGDDEEADEEDETGASEKVEKTNKQKVYKPRIYKWRAERKR